MDYVLQPFSPNGRKGSDMRAFYLTYIYIWCKIFSAIFQVQQFPKTRKPVEVAKGEGYARVFGMVFLRKYFSVYLVWIIFYRGINPIDKIHITRPIMYNRPKAKKI